MSGEVVELPAPKCNIGSRPEFGWFDPDDLHCDERYQRDHETARSQKLVRDAVENFHWSKFQPPTVALVPTPEGNDCWWAILDGWHRVEMCRQHPLIEQVPCFIVEAKELKTQAAGFVAINKNRLNMHALQIHHAALAAGDPDALHIKRVLDQCDVAMPRSPTPTRDLRPNQTMALATIRGALKAHGDRPVTRTLRLLREAFPELPNQLRGQSIAALVRFFNRFVDSQIDWERMVETIRQCDLAQMQKAASDLQKLNGGTITEALCDAIIHRYNKGLPKLARLGEGVDK